MTNLLVIIAARDEADRIGATIDALKDAFPGAEIWVGDDASADGTADAALRHGAQVVRRGTPHGKGGNVTAAAQAALGEDGRRLVLVCDGDLGASAERLRPLVEAVESGSCDLAIAGFRHRIGGGFGACLTALRPGLF